MSHIFILNEINHRSQHLLEIETELACGNGRNYYKKYKSATLDSSCQFLKLGNQREKSSKRIIWNGPDMKLVMVCVEPDKLRSTLVTWYENRICCLLYRRKDQHKRDPRPLLLFFQ